jgi:hypothetical protein
MHYDNRLESHRLNWIVNCLEQSSIYCPVARRCTSAFAPNAQKFRSSAAIAAAGRLAYGSIGLFCDWRATVSTLLAPSRLRANHHAARSCDDIAATLSAGGCVEHLCRNNLFFQRTSKHCCVEIVSRKSVCVHYTKDTLAALQSHERKDSIVPLWSVAQSLTPGIGATFDQW